MDPVVELDSGSIRGLVQKHEDGFNYYAFKGIPFAEPPIGEFRFQDPIPKKKWTGILDCKNFGPLGFQHDIYTNEDSYDEDCLHLNVYSCSINKPNKNDPVIAWIHGGEFSFGSADDTYCGPDYLIRKNVVLVTVNFRLGVLGFLDLEDEVAPGNQGLKDVVMALQWVQKNIPIFGGDPNNVTIGGVTAGSAMVHYLALSPLTKNIIHKLIFHGNSAYNPWVGIVNPRSHAIKFCSLLGKNLTDSKEIVQFLKTVDTKTLHEVQQRFRDDFLDCIPFGPGSDSKASNPVLPFHRYKTADQGVHLPSLVGYASREGLLTLYENNIDKFVDIASDIHFIEGIHRFARKQIELSSAATYLYKFDYDSQDSLSKLLLKNAPTGAGHYDDIPYLWKMGLILERGGKHFEKGSKGYKLMEQMTEMWVNFATYGRPTVETSELLPVKWQPVADGMLLRYMNIGDDLTMKSMLNVDQKFLSAMDTKV